MKIEKGNINEVFNNLEQTLLAPNKLGAFYGIHDHLSVNYGLDKDINLHYCNLNNIPISFLPRKGGTIIFNKGDFSIVVVDKPHKSFSPGLVAFLIQKLKARGIDASEEGNDLIIDNHYKVSGCTKRVLEDGRIWSCMHISITDDLTIATMICLKPKGKLKNGLLKQPAGLSRWGVSAEEIEKWVLEYTREHFKGELINEKM